MSKSRKSPAPSAGTVAILEPAARASTISQELKKAGAPDGGISARAAIALIVALTLVGAIMRFMRLGAMGLWFDEIHTLTQSAFPNSWSGPHQLFFRVDGWFQRLTSDPTLGVRLLPALCGALTIPAMIGLAGRASGRRAGLLAGALVCFQPFQLFQSQEGRFYAPMILLSAVGLWGLVEWLFGSGRARWGGLFATALAAVISPLNHPAAAPFALGLAIAAVGLPLCDAATRRTLRERLPARMRGAGRGAALASGIALGAVMLALICIALRRPMGRMGRSLLKGEWGSTPGVDLTWAFARAHLVAYGWDFSQLPILGRLTPVVNAAIGLAGLAAAFRTRRALAAALTIPPALTMFALFAYPMDHPYDVKYAACLLPPFLTALAAGLDGAGRAAMDWARKRDFGRIPVGAAPALLGLVAIAGQLPAVFAYYGGSKMPLREQFRWLTEHEPAPAEVYVYGHTGFPASLYRSELAPRHTLHYFPWFETDGLLEREVMQTQAGLGRPVYFAHAWPHDVPTGLLDWLKSDAEPAFRAPSLMGPRNAGVLSRIPPRPAAPKRSGRVPAAWIMSFEPPGRPRVAPGESGAMDALELTINTTFSYPWRIEKGATYEFEAEVDSGAQGGYFLMVGPPGQEPMLLGADLVPGKPQVLRGRFTAGVAADSLKVSYASDYAVPERERSLILRGVSLGPATTRPMTGYFPMPKAVPLGVPWNNAGALAKNWTFHPNELLQPSPESTNADRLAVKIGPFPRAERPLIARVVSPMFRVGAGDLVSFRAQARLRGGYGVSAAPALFLVNPAGEIVAQITMSTRGASQGVDWDPWVGDILDESWIEFEGAALINDGVAFCSVGMIVWETAGQRRIPGAENELQIRPIQVSILRKGQTTPEAMK